MTQTVVKIKLLAAGAGVGMMLLSGCSLVSGLGKSGTANSSAVSTSSSVSVQSVSVPTADAIVGRIQKALPTVSPASGNFKTALAQISTNLPNTPDPTKATGLDQIPLLIYAACMDVNPSTYQVNVGQSVSSNQANLVNAGIQMVNLHIGGLASNSAYSQQASNIFAQLVTEDATAGASTAVTFVSICMAANSFGVGMVGF